MPTEKVQRWVDSHQYDAAPQPTATAHSGVMPTVHLLHMTEDPLGVLAAQNGIYRGEVIRHLSEVTDGMRRQALDDMLKTTLQSPLESIKMHWLFEGVDRAFTHQHVRQRTANFGQESLRFAVMGDLIDATTLPPELHGTQRWFQMRDEPESDSYPTEAGFADLLSSREFTFANQPDRNRAVWDWVIHNVDAAYHYLTEHGLAAEEARGLLPHCTATRIHYQVDLRNLMKTAGERLCTQAQFHWKLVMAQVVDAIRNYTPDFSWAPNDRRDMVVQEWQQEFRWQFELIADSGIFRPVCYHTSKCMFQASADRGCTIRGRVEELAGKGVPSEEWGEFISPVEWLANPAAARGD